MERFNQALDFSNLPVYLSEEISGIIRPFYVYFFEDFPIRQDIINNINQDRLRLVALEDLYNDSVRLFEEYNQVIKNYTEKLEKYHLSSLFFDSGFAMEGCLKAGSITSDKGFIQYSIEYNEFKLCGIDYNNELEKLEKILKKLSIKLEIEDKYATKKIEVKPKVETPTLNLNKEFLNLFRSEITASQVIEILKADDYLTVREELNPKVSHPGTLRDVYLALQKLSIIKHQQDYIKGIGIFYARFGESVYKENEKGTISERSCRDHKPTRAYDSFLEKFEHLAS